MKIKVYNYSKYIIISVTTKSNFMILVTAGSNSKSLRHFQKGYKFCNSLSLKTLTVAIIARYFHN